MPLRHLVLFRVHPHVQHERVEAAMDELRSLEGLPMVMSLVVARSLDDRKGRVIVEDLTFTDAAGLAAFRATPQHAEVAQTMSEISDWWIGDYETV